MKRTTIGKLARWYNIFSGWEWPDDFFVAKPLYFDGLPEYSKDKNVLTKHIIITPINQIIRDIVGNKECLRYHHIHNLGMKNWQFEFWWFFSSNFNRPLWFDIYGFMKWRRAG